MAQTYIGSTLRTGSGTLTDTTDGGYVVVSQTVEVTSLASGAAAVGTITLPASSQIINIFVDKTQLQVVGGGTATTLPCLVGSTSGGGEYVPSVDMFTTVRSNGVMTVATLAAMANIGNNTAVYCSVDPNGTISTTQAKIRFTVVYAQKV
jgi:hypothetical protein